jgi:hypothetical protein
MSDENASRYCYSRLPANCIRVLRISSPPTQIDIEITLRVISLNDSHAYDCLSYTWGDPQGPSLSEEKMTAETTEKIYSQDHFIEVSQNCLHALRRLSGDLHRQPWIWIDAICIDQKSPEEKNEQIPLMGEIYKNACDVIVWLGQEDEGTKYAQKLLRGLSRVTLSPETLASQAYNVDPNQAWEQLEEVSITMGLDDAGPDEWRNLAHFLQRIWFSRVWVVQEVFFSRRPPRVFIGEQSLEWDEMMNSMEILAKTHLDTVLKAYISILENQEMSGTNANATAGIVDNRLANARIFGIMHTKKKNLDFRLDQLLYYTRYFNASVPKDHIYGIQGLWTSASGGEGPAKALPPYDSSYEKICIESMRIAITETGRLDILGLRGSISANMPSWVVDFDQKPQLYPLTRNLELEDCPRRWQAGRGLIPAQMHTTTDESPRKLLVDGIEFDGIIGELGPSFADVDTDFRIGKLLQFLAHARLNQYGAMDIYASFVRTITKDTYNGEPTAAELCGAFSAFLTMRIWEHELALEPGAYVITKDTKHALAKSLKDTEYILEELSVKYSTFPSWTKIQESRRFLEQDGTAEKIELDRQIMEFSESFRIAYFGRRLFQTEKGYFGITCEMVEEGDRIWISSSSDTPLVLRPQRDGEYILVGEAYIHGIMNGEAVGGSRSGHAYVI